MKTILSTLLYLLPFFLRAQTIDTATVEKQVDSLTQLSRAPNNQFHFDWKRKLMNPQKRPHRVSY